MDGDEKDEEDKTDSLTLSRINNRSRLIATTRILCEMIRGKWELRAKGSISTSTDTVVVAEMRNMLNVLLEEKLWREDVFMVSEMRSSKRRKGGDLESIPSWMIDDHAKNPQDGLLRLYYSTLLRSTLLQTLSLIGVYCGDHFSGLIESMMLFRVVSCVGDPFRMVHKSAQWSLFVLSKIKQLSTSLALVATNATILIDAIARRLRILEEYPHTTNLLNALIICAIDTYKIRLVQSEEVEKGNGDEADEASSVTFVSLVEDTMDSVFEGLDRMITSRSHLPSMLSVVSNFCRLLGVKSDVESGSPQGEMEMENASQWEATKPVDARDLRLKKETQLLIDSLKRCSHFLGNKNDTIRSIALDIVRHAAWSLRRDRMFPLPKNSTLFDID